MEDYRHGFPITDKRIKSWISRADVADFMLKQLVDDKYLHQTPGVSNQVWCNTTEQRHTCGCSSYTPLMLDVGFGCPVLAECLK